MITLLLYLLRLLPFLCGGHRQLALENLALRQQLAVYKRTVPRPRLRRTDRLLWVWLARVRAAWRQPLLIVTPDTVLRWQRRRFREHWTTPALRACVTCACSGVTPVREPDAGKPHVWFDEEGRETRDGPLGEWTPDPKGRKRWGAAGPGHDRARPSLYPVGAA
jgi:hypothetical protein